MTKTATLTVTKLLTEDEYIVPLYQRNFSWTYDEIEQLLIDIADAYNEREKRPDYYIGTLVVHQKGNMYHIIDGQQRTTALTLLALVLRNEYHIQIPGLKLLNFEARKQSNASLQQLFENSSAEFENMDEIIRGYQNTKLALNKILSEQFKMEVMVYAEYLFQHVIIFRNMLPTDLDLNLYFERFNSRGEQLEAHEIVKAQLMAKLDDEEAAKFAKIWDACADFENPVVKSFQMRKKRKETFKERENIFGWHFSNYKLANIYRFIDNTNSSKKSILAILEDLSSLVFDDIVDDKETGKYTTVINFETLLLYTVSIIENISPQDVQLDDKKLLDVFTVSEKGSDWVVCFSETLLSIRHLFDNYVIRNASEDTSRRSKNDWFLSIGTYYEYQRDNRKNTDYFVEEHFENNTFSDKAVNDTIIMLQSMFAVTFTSNRDSRWLYETLVYLFENVEHLQDEAFGHQFVNFLEALAVRYAEGRLFTEDGQEFRCYPNMSVYAFNFIDYVLWKNQNNLQEYFFDSRNFRFTYRRSVEHWYPQNPNFEDSGMLRMSDSLLHSFGNLCIITDSQNSKFGNSRPQAKYSQWEKIFGNQSLKLQWMAKLTGNSDDNWNNEVIRGHEDKILMLVKEFIDCTKNI
ncbi:TPA: DUF262 domain-containing protein [Streptococcus suis]|nr:DUF262 domain-containing protein [Streptococcus suis]